MAILWVSTSYGDVEDINTHVQNMGREAKGKF